MKLFAEELLTFPNPQQTLDEGIVDLSDDLRVDRLLEAYSFGIFPWPHQDLPTLWYCPEKRGILEFKDVHVPRSLEKFIRQSELTWTFNTAFDRVLEACAYLRRPDQSGTWITPKLMEAFLAFHYAGYAHSLEVWDDGDLIGGLYGVYVGGVFSGESMFHLKPNASKFALVKVIEFLKENGVGWMDIQMVTPLLENLGGKYVSRLKFLKMVEESKKSARPIKFKI